MTNRVGAVMSTPHCPTHPATRLVCPRCIAEQPRKALSEAERARRRAILARVRARRWQRQE